MKSNRLFGLLFAAAALCFAAVAGVARPAFELVLVTARAFKNLVLDGFKLAANTTADKQRSVLPFVQARSFVARFIKRDRPVKSTDWSMCPST